MKVAIRVDASNAIGSGHFMRCLTLANSLQPFADDICFVCRALPQYLQEQLALNGHRLAQLPATTGNHAQATEGLAHSHWLAVSQKQDAADTAAELHTADYDWLVVDHYGIDQRWERSLRGSTKNILVIDDLADRSHDCNALIDQNIYHQMESRYAGKVPKACTLFLGAKYAFLRDEFHQQRANIRIRGEKNDKAVANLLIYFGGVDADNHTLEAIEALLETGGDVRDVNVVIGAQHPDRENIQAVCAAHGFNCHVQTPRMAELMAEADLAIGAGGISAYERLYMRLPSLLRPIASNQVEQLECMAADGLCELYSNRADLVSKLTKALSHPLPSPAECVADGNIELVAHMVAQAKRQTPSK